MIGLSIQDSNSLNKKRIEIIYSLLELGEYSEINSHLNKLIDLKSDDDLSKIVDLLRANKYHEALNMISIYKNNSSYLVVNTSPEIIELKKNITTLEIELSALEAEKVELERRCRQFEAIYYSEVGELIADILNIKKNLADMKSKKDPAFNKYFDDARADYDAFFKDFNNSQKQPSHNLSEEDAKEIKNVYRKAVKLCHPDKVSDDVKEQASKIFNELHLCYVDGNLGRVREIYEQLLHGNALKLIPKSLDDITLLKKQQDILTKSIIFLKMEITIIRESYIFKTLIEAIDIDKYIANVKVELNKELFKLRKTFAQYDK
jgi:hypothetical protein